MFAGLQRLGKSLMLPIAVLPVASILIGLGLEGVLDIPFIYQAGLSIVDNLPLIFAIGVGIGLSKDNHGAAGLAGAIGYLILTNSMQAINEELDMAVLGGLLSGIVAALVYNRFNQTQLPEFLAFFAGKRLVPILTGLIMVALGGLLGLLWLPVQNQIFAFGEWMVQIGAIGSGLFGLINRLLIPLGLHHVLNTLVWFEFGEYNGAYGDIGRFLAGDPSAGMFSGGFYITMMFGLPAAAMAIAAAAEKGRRKATFGAMVSIAFTSFLTGITEPIEFSFMFLAPVLYLFHAILTGLALFIVNIADIHHSFAFSAGAIDFLLQLGNAEDGLLIIPIGLGFSVLYFVIFYLSIRLFDLKTPGREELEEEIVSTAGNESAGSANKYEWQADQFLQALGGSDNIRMLDYCVTRLRVQVEDMEKISETQLKQHGARGVVKMNQHSVHVVVGTQVEAIAMELQKRL